jgi:hypothetical protein
MELSELINKSLEIKFTEKDHSYKYKKIKAKYSVTQFIKKFFHEFDSDRIISQMMMSKNWNKSKYNGMSKEEIKELWEENRDQESKLGTEMHENFENFLNSSFSTDKSDYIINKELFSLQRFLIENKFLTWKTSELRIFNEKYRIAGSIDAIFYHEYENSFVILDWKRSKEIKYKSYDFGKHPIENVMDTNYWHYSLQLNMYKYLLSLENFKVEKMYLLHVNPENFEYKLIAVPNMQEEIKKMLATVTTGRIFVQ